MDRELLAPIALTPKALTRRFPQAISITLHVGARSMFLGRVQLGLSRYQSMIQGRSSETSTTRLPFESQHGMVVSPDGQVTVFDPPGSILTDPLAINNLGTVVGSFYDERYKRHGFVRTRDGQITTIDFPGAISTQFFGINDLGAITGWYVDASFVAHGFLREPNGSYITIDGPNAPRATFCFVLNASGEVGCHYLANAEGNFWRGLLRHRDGSIEVFDAPGVVDNRACFYPPQGVVLPSGTEIGYFRSLTNAGVVSGHSEDEKCQLHGFVRSPTGGFEVFALPPTAVWALAGAINSVNGFGTVVGCYGFQNNRDRGYVRFPGGDLIAVVPPHPKHKGVCPLAINSVNVFTGYWLDAKGTAHGFVAEAIP